jgi:Mg-chelatase subunit ChlD
MARRKKEVVVKPKQYVAIVLDKSGSMETCRDATISGFNEQLQVLKDAAGNKEVIVSMYTFNMQVDQLFTFKNINEVAKITREDYTPGGTTAMLDGVGRAIDDVKKKLEGDTESQVLFLIMSDGYENASRTYNYATIAEKIQELQKTKQYTFTYMGSNQDLSVLSKQLNIPLGNMAVYDSSSIAGNIQASNVRNVALKTYFARAGGQSCSFYSDVEASKDKDQK